MSSSTPRRRSTRCLLVLGGTLGVLLACGGWWFLDYWRKGCSATMTVPSLSTDIPTRDERGGGGAIEPPPLEDLARRSQSTEAKERAEALCALAKLGREGKPLAPQVVRLLDDKSLVRLPDDESSSVRQEAVTALFEIAGKEALPLLMKYLSTDPDADFCGRIVGGASCLPAADGDAISCLILGLRREGDDYEDAGVDDFYGMREFAFYELIYRGEHAVPKLLKVIKDKREKPLVRASALDALNRIALNARHGIAGRAITSAVDAWNRIAPMAEEAVSVLVPLVDDADHDLSRLAIDGLGEWGRGSAAARRCLEKVVKNGETLSKRLDAASSLYAVDPANRLSVPAIIPGLRSDDASTRRVAADKLKDIGSPAKDAVPALIDVLGDKSFYVRRYAIWALQRIGPAAAAAVPRLRELQNDPNESIRSAVADALVEIQRPPQK